MVGPLRTGAMRIGAMTAIVTRRRPDMRTAAPQVSYAWKSGQVLSQHFVELRGFEPLTPCMPCRCATSCATAP